MTIDRCVPADIYRAEVWWRTHVVFAAAGHAAAGAEALSRGRAWVNDEVLPTVPGELPARFISGNPVNVALLAPR